LKLKLRSSNPFLNAIVPNEGQSLICSRVAAKIARLNNVNSEIIGRKFTNFVHDVAGLLPFNPFESGFMIGQSVVERRINQFI